MQKTDVKISNLETFIAIVETGSISRAAEMLDVPTSNVSRHLRQLEDSLGCRLLERTTRRQALTEAGERFYSGSQDLLRNLENLCGEVGHADHEINGRLSVFSPADFLRLILDGKLQKFSETYPKLEFEFLSGAMRPDLLHDRLDLIIHPDAPQDSSFVAMKLGEIPTDFFASPSFLANRVLPRHPRELSNYEAIVELTQDRQPRPWIYSEGRKIDTVQITARYRCDSLPLARDMAEQGFGIAMLPVFACEEAIRRGRLARVFEENYEAYHSIYAIHSSRRLTSRKLEVFLRFLKESLPTDL